MIDELFINWIASLGVAAMTFYAVKLQGSFGLFYMSYVLAVSVD